MLQFFFMTLVAAAMAEVLHDGACHEIKPVENFNLTAFQGLWYQIQKFPGVTATEGKCMTTEYKVEGDILKMTNAHVSNGAQNFLEGTVKFANDAKNSAKMVVSVKYDGITKETPFNVIATDYENYAITYGCRFDDKKNTHGESVWVLSRNKKLEGEAKTAVDNFLKEHEKEIEAAKFIVIDLSEKACMLSSSSSASVPNSPKKQ